MLNKKTQGFTLIELLIVIAIIGILAAVLIPNLLSARNRANDTAAQSYLSQAVTQQEIHQIDNQDYATDTELKDAKYLGAKAAPGNVNLLVVDQSPTGYCMTSSSPAGTSGVVFFATATDGIVRSNGGTPAVCTTAK